MSRSVPPRQTEGGAVAVIVIIGLVAFFGLGALVVDLGFLRAERSDVQNVADNVALAAAWADCNNRGDPFVEGQAVAARNGTSATITSLGSGRWEAAVEGDIDTTFAPAAGGGATMETRARAVAECQTGPGGPYAIFGGSETCATPATAEWSGSITSITGNVHSNSVTQIQSDSVIVGEVTGQGEIKSGGGLVITLDPPEDNPRATGYKPYPYEYDIADFRPGNTVFAASEYHEIPPGPGGKYELDITLGLDSGVYYAPDDLKVTSSSDVGPELDITVVAEGAIQGNNLYKKMSAFHEDLLFFSWTEPPASCNETGLKLSGSNIAWEGILYAPNAGIELSASDISSLNGALIGNTVNVSGSSFSIDASTLPPADVPFAALLE